MKSKTNKANRANKAVRTYLRRVSRLMCCSRGERRDRLQGLEESILEAAEQQPFDTPDQVATLFGSPEDMAEELMESLPLEEELFHKTRQLSRLRIVIACLAVLLACSLALLFYWKFIYVTPVIDLADPSLYSTGP